MPNGTVYRCDDACHKAKGDICKCICGGGNHGKKLLVGQKIYFMNAQTHMDQFTHGARYRKLNGRHAGEEYFSSLFGEQFYANP